MRTFLLSILVFCFGGSGGEAKEHLFVVPARSKIAARSPIYVDVYLYNEGPDAVELPPMEYLAADWTLDDTTGKRLGRTGGSARISSIRPANVTIRAGTVLHRRLKLDVDAEPGDMVAVQVSLAARRAIKSTEVLLYCGRKSR